jgi:uncharacterized protein YukE
MTGLEAASRLTALADQLDQLAAHAADLADRIADQADQTTWRGPAARAFLCRAAERAYSCRNYGRAIRLAAGSVRQASAELYDTEQRRRTRPGVWIPAQGRS